MRSKTFTAGKHRITVKKLVPVRPTGLAAVGYTTNGFDITVKVDDVVHQRIGGIKTTNGKYYIYIGSITGLCRHANTAANTHKHVTTIREAFDQICNHIIAEETMCSLLPAS